VFRIILGLIILVVIAGCGKEQATASKSKSPLICHVGGTMRPLIAKLAKLYEDKTGQKISINSVFVLRGKMDAFSITGPILGKSSC